MDTASKKTCKYAVAHEKTLKRCHQPLGNTIKHNQNHNKISLSPWNGNFQIMENRAGEMSHWVKALTAQPDDLNLLHIVERDTLFPQVIL